MKNVLNEATIEEIFARRGGFSLVAKYPSKVCAAYDYMSTDINGCPNNLSYTVRVHEDGRFELSFHPSWCLAGFKMGAMRGFENYKRFASITEQFAKGVARLEGFCM